MLDEYQHDDFEVVRKDTRFGGFEELKLRREDTTVIMFMSLTSLKLSSMELEKRVMKDGCSGALYPMYTRDGHRWALMSCRSEPFIPSDSLPSCDVRRHKVHLPKWRKVNRQSSREGIGVWHVGNYAWKVYSAKNDSQRNTLEKLREDYRRADVHGLPMGRPRFQDGTIKQGNGNPYNGMALIVDWFEGTNFNFHRPPKPFKSALEAQKISHSKSSTDYKKIKAGCESAKAVGLQDCQGYVKAGRYEPIVFIDVHTSWNAQQKKFGSSQQAIDMVDIITAWGTQS
ncbi:hypothetical protein EDD16DRAFT_1483638 [Pisolithus croceorrhizus]|nr:hypothetical protein EV401DRAFT_1869747 [Pisolithus croceorrhizus]KAI6113907.1 hypothetical protein EDD16DRAFT_1483638 [Pisolithus croceorrhizus]KAI6160244.1 hypothetical protein EDD17DRAFT_1485041 [Pisolithus thermaeus]